MLNRSMMRKRLLRLTMFAAVILVAKVNLGQETSKESDNLARENLVAWCIVPFDAKKRGPSERAAMIERLGLRRVAYDWRDEHVPTFEQEILEYKKRDLEFFAFWDWHPEFAPLVKKHKIRPQFWLMFPSPESGTQQEKVEAAAKELLPRVEAARELGCRVGLYNHGGWSGEPENLVAVCRWLRDHHKAMHVGIVYNFHHGHDHIDDFAEALKSMKPYLLCLNLNGMNRKADPKIQTIGDGPHEHAMMKAIREQGYRGPIGILDHRQDLDAEVSLRLNLDGLDRLRRQLD